MFGHGCLPRTGGECHLFRSAYSDSRQHPHIRSALSALPGLIHVVYIMRVNSFQTWHELYVLTLHLPRRPRHEDFENYFDVDV
jgi:hypothetical protein